MDAGALAGIRVLEFSQIVAGPVTGINLSDLGADVIKVEPPGGEAIRRSGSVVPGESKAYQAYNRGKRGIVIDLHDPRGLEVVHRLIPQIDVVITNFRPGVPQRLGIDYDSLRALRDDLIYLEATAFGTTGPEAGRPGNDGVARAYSGMSGGDAGIDEHGMPIFIGSTPIADYATSIAAAMGICAALFHRERTGEGQYIGASLLRSAIFIQALNIMREPVTDASTADVIRADIAEARARGAPWTELIELRKDSFKLRASNRIFYHGYEASDGAVLLGALTPPSRNTVRELFDMQDERSDQPDFDAADPSIPALVEQWQQHIGERIKTKTVAEWLEIFEASGIPCSPFRLPEEMWDEPHARATGMVVDIEHPITGTQTVAGPILEMSATPAAARGPSPTTGQHTREVLAELGFAEGEVAALLEQGVVE